MCTYFGTIFITTISSGVFWSAPQIVTDIRSFNFNKSLKTVKRMRTIDTPDRLLLSINFISKNYSQSMSNLRSMVLQNFKKLHRTRMKIFHGDTRALIAARNKINEEFKKNKHVTDTDSIMAMLKFSNDVEVELRTQVIQAREVKPGVFEARILEETLKLDNIPYNDKAIPNEQSDKPAPCCQDQATNK